MIERNIRGTYHDTESGFDIHTSFDNVGPAIQARRDAIISIDGGTPEKYILEVNLQKTGPYHFSERIWKGEAIKYGSGCDPNGNVIIAEGLYQEVVQAFKTRCNINIVSLTDMKNIVLDCLKLGDEPIPTTSTSTQAKE